MDCSAKAWHRHCDGSRCLRDALHRNGCRTFPASPPNLFHAVKHLPLGINGIAIVTLIVIVAGITTSSVERRVSAEVRRLHEDLERGVAGLDFQGELAETNIQIPITFITAHGEHSRLGMVAFRGRQIGVAVIVLQSGQISPLAEFRLPSTMTHEAMVRESGPRERR